MNAITDVRSALTGRGMGQRQAITFHGCMWSSADEKVCLGSDGSRRLLGGEELARDQEARARRARSHSAEMGVWVTKRPGTRKGGSKSNLGQRLVIQECEVWEEKELHKAWRQWKGAGRLGTWKACVWVIMVGGHRWRGCLHLGRDQVQVLCASAWLESFSELGSCLLV